MPKKSDSAQKLKVIILAAGYGTRLAQSMQRKIQELQEKKSRKLADFSAADQELLDKCEANATRAKPLVLLHKKPVIDYILEKVKEIESLDLNDIYIVTNEIFKEQFLVWAEQYKFPLENIVNDRTKNNDSRLGPGGDIAFTCQEKEINSPILILAGDTLFDFNLNEMAHQFQEQNNNLVAVYPEKKEKISRYGMIDLAATGKMIDFQEKPQELPGRERYLAAPMIYMLQPECLKWIKKFFRQGDYNIESNFLEKLHKEIPVYGYVIDGREDIGNFEDWLEVTERYRQREQKELRESEIKGVRK